MTRWRLDIAYDGANFSGWAAQPGRRTVQGELETWIPRVLRLGEPTPLTVAGRTDAGVHARGQVAHVDLPDGIDTSSMLRRLARVLDSDVVVRSIRPLLGLVASLRLPAVGRVLPTRSADAIPRGIRTRAPRS